MIKSAALISSIGLALAFVRPGYAQETPRAPRLFQGLFGPTGSDLAQPRRVDLTWSVYDAQDDNTALVANGSALSDMLARQWYSGGTASLMYAQHKRQSAFTLKGFSAVRYYPALQQVVTTTFGGGMTFDGRLTRSWRLQMSDDAGYSPFYQVMLAPSAPGLAAPDAPAPSADYAVSTQHAMQYASFTGLTHSYSERSSLAFNYGGQYTQVLGGPDSRSQRAGVLFTRAMAKGFGVRLGYAYGVAMTGADPAALPIRNNDIDLGVSYGGAISPSSRTSFSFSTGSAIISSGDGRHFRVTGSGRLLRRLSPMWTANLTYDRGLQVPDGATRPFFSDTLGANVSGYVSRRVRVRVQPAYSHGVVGFAGVTNSYDSYATSERLEVALGRRVALYAEHFYYRYQFASAVGLPGLLTEGSNRQGARVGLSLWTPWVP